jgi:hypothetical protein
MANSPLDFASTESFRKKLMARNLAAYGKSPNKPDPPLNYVYRQTDSSVIDSPDELIDQPIFAKELYAKNQYGAEGGYKQAPDPTGLLGNKSNEGEYGFQDANILDQALPASKEWKRENAYSNGNQLPIDSAPFFESNNIIQTQDVDLYNNQPYPTTFVPSIYPPVSILLNKDPRGSNGLLSQDSFIARIGAQQLRKDFENRIASIIRRNTLGRINFLNASSGTDVLNMVTGIVPLIEPNYQITAPANPVIAATDFALRLAGSYIPVSPIPGSYFDPSINPGQPTTIQQLTNAFRRSQIGNFFSTLLGSPKTGSQLFLNNTGQGQKQRLFGNLNYNKFKPDYDRGFLDRASGAIVGGVSDNSNYYIGSRSSEPSRIFSPGGDIPVDQFGRENQSPVYGPSELAQLYEGPSRQVRLGANGPAYINGGGIEGGFTWVSPKYKDNAGKRVGIGGEVTNQDEDFKPSSYDTTQSTNIEFRGGSILDDTQRLINSQPQGGRRLQHVGNAIDQVSKVFNDGYNELTKGSRVIKYEGAPGQEVGTEYCRVFSKDVPYLQYNDLQKKQGITTQNRKITWSVLDSTYNLNIVPNSQEGGQDSTNLIGSGNLGTAKKYMFSIENLAWRTSNKPGFTVADLPICEKGPNGGRVMWFPPYDLKFNENSSASWRDTNFLGRPEPVYTYSHTNRTGSLQWKMIVDHPSILNVIVDKVLGNESNKARIDSIITSFMAGCRTYDIYELAKKYSNVSINDLIEIQKALDYREVTKEQLTYIQQTTTTGNDQTQGQDTNQGTVDVKSLETKLSNKGFYFDNDIPSSGSISYSSLYSIYTSPTSKTNYEKSASTQNKGLVTKFFPDVIEYNYNDITASLTELYNLFENKSIQSANLSMTATASPPATNDYNKKLAQRRFESVVKFIEEFQPAGKQKKLKDIAEGKLTFDGKQILGEDSSSITTINAGGLPSTPYNCKSSNSDSKATDKEIATPRAMACRRVSITSAKLTPVVPVAQNTVTQPQQKIDFVEKKEKITTQEPFTVEKSGFVKNISKKIVRMMLSECDYFETIKETTPMVYDNLRDKLKFFDPAFHSMTPEGLNSRLTFLNQCLRPGDTIPVVKKDAQGNTVLNYNDAFNTAFGSPPVLVLRVGDFYNTKIIPDGLQISYENLDINPEGIGVQPMIANVNLSFKFVGGSGIKEAVDKIQNALSFNYYANTEIYDDRADTTDTQSLSQIDYDFKQMFGNVPPPTTNQTQNNNGQSNLSFIGEVLEQGAIDTVTTGKTDYKKFMAKLSDDTQSYFQAVVNKNKEILDIYNEGVRQLWSLDRLYTKGRVVTNDVPSNLFGKPSTFQKNIDKVINDLDSDVQGDNDKFIQFLKKPELDFSDKVIRAVKTNYKNYLSEKKNTFTNSVTKVIQEITIQQQDYIQTLARLNVIVFGDMTPGQETGTDGYAQKNGYINQYYLTNVDTVKKLREDGEKIGVALSEFIEKITKETSFKTTGNQEYYATFTYDTIKQLSPKGVFSYIGNDVSWLSENFQREYVVLGDDIKDPKKYESFKNKMIGSIMSNPKLFGGSSNNTELDKQFDVYWKTIAKPVFDQQNTLAKDFITTMEKDKDKLLNYLNFTPYDKNQERKTDFSNDPVEDSGYVEDRKKLITSLGNTTNPSSQNKEWNVDSGGLKITMIKLN